MNYKRIIKNSIFLFILLLLVTNTFAYDNVRHFGIATLDNSQLANQLAQRLNAKGKPLFIISDPTIGVSQGDIIRFKDKAILITPDIWKTLKVMGALKYLKPSNIIRVKAKAQSSFWKRRARKVKKSNTKKAYIIGAEILKIFEEYFGRVPSKEEIVLQFEGEYLTIVTSNSLLNRLRYNKVMKVRVGGKPKIISLPPKENYFVNEEIYWQIWAVDTKLPGARIFYKMLNPLYDSLIWDNDEHVLKGVFKKPGEYKFTFIAISESKLTDTLKFTIKVDEDRAPVLSDCPIREIEDSTLFEFQPLASDYDHPSKDVYIELVSGPNGMNFINGKIVYFIPPIGNSKKYNLVFTLKARDKLNKTTFKNYKIKVIPRHIKKMKFIFNFPLDTLKQYKVYSLKNHNWLQPGIKVLKIYGSKLVYYKNLPNNDGLLVVKPENEGDFILNFILYVDGDTILEKKVLQVKPNLAPVFKSALGSYTFNKNQIIYYTPVVVDPDNDSVYIKAYYKDKFLGFVNSSIKLETGEEGVYSYKFEAFDIHGNKAEQYIVYNVSKQIPVFKGIEFSIVHHAEVALNYRTNNLRVGLYTQDVFKSLAVSSLSDYNLPLIFIGANLLPFEEIKKGDYLFFDAGANLRSKGKKIICGGLMGRLDGKFKNIFGSPWVFEHTLQLFLKQAILVIDTSGFDDEVKKNFDSFSKEVLTGTNILDAFNNNYSNVSELMKEYSDTTNAEILIKVATWYPIGKRFWTGPTSWIIGYPLSDNLSSTIGWGLYHDYMNGNIIYKQSLRLGFNVSQRKFSILWDFDILVGK